VLRLPPLPKLCKEAPV